MDHKEREGKANLAPVREFIPRFFSNMQGLRWNETEPRGKLRIIPVGATPGVDRWRARGSLMLSSIGELALLQTDCLLTCGAVFEIRAGSRSGVIELSLPGGLQSENAGCFDQRRARWEEDAL
jgi:hypothetical protein